MFFLPVLPIKNMHLQKCLTFGVHIITLVSIFLFTLLTGCSNSASENNNNISEVRNENPASDFNYSIDADNNIGIERYIGQSTNVVIPEKIDGLPVTAILPNAFAGTNIESVDIPDTVTIIWDDAFNCCQELHTVKMGNGVTKIGTQSFKKCKNLKVLTLSKNLIKLGTSAFEQCENLEEVFIPKTVSEWGMQVFFGCPLTSLTFEDGIKSIGSYASFWGSVFNEITIPASVEQFGEYTFHDNLEKIVFLGDAPKETGKQPFGTKATIYCKESSDGWNNSVFEKYSFIYQ